MELKNMPVLRNLLRWSKSAQNAIEGILYAAQTERHFKIHLLSAFLVITASFVLGLAKDDFITVIFICLLVMMAEMFNTAIEVVVDMVSPDYSVSARIAKDIAAGAVLICAIVAVVFGYIIFWPHLVNIYYHGFSLAKYTAEYVEVYALAIVLIIIVWLKVIFGHEHPLRGGGASGFSAIAFSLWTAVALCVQNVWVIFSLFLVAVAISMARLYKRVHSLIGIVMGAVIGTGITVFIFWLFKI